MTKEKKQSTTATIENKSFNLDNIAFQLHGKLTDTNIEDRIKRQVINDSLEIESIEFVPGKDEVKIKMTELGLSTYVVKCMNPKNQDLILAYVDLKKHVDYFKEYNLPDEYQLLMQFENIKIKNIGKGWFDEKEEEKLKHKILSQASIEKIFICKVELCALIDGEATIEFYKFTILGINKKTGMFEEDQLCLNKRGVHKDHEEAKPHYVFIELIEKLFDAAKIHLREFYIFKEGIYKKRYNRYLVEASQGQLFSDLTQFEQKYLADKVHTLSLIKEIDAEEVFKNESLEPSDFEDEESL